jgi:hypothetical protein
VPVLSLPEPEVVSEPELEPEEVPEPEPLEPEPEEVVEPPVIIIVSNIILSLHRYRISHQGDILGHEARASLTTVAESSLGQAWAVQSRTPYS